MRSVHPAAWHGGDKMEMTEADLLRRKFFDDHAEGWEDHNYSPEVLATFGRGEDMSARTLADILQAVKGQKVDGVVDNLQSGAKSGLPLALELGVPHVVLSNFPDSSPDVPDWFSLFSAGVSALAGI